MPANKADYVSPAGDGMAIVFPSKNKRINSFDRSILTALNLAIHLHTKLSEYNKSLRSLDMIGVRIGISSSEILVIEDILGNRVHSGEGMVMAYRIMEIGEWSHILLSSRVGKNLAKYGPKQYRQWVHPIGRYQIKHGVKDDVWSFYNADYENPFGNKDKPNLHKKI